MKHNMKTFYVQDKDAEMVAEFQELATGTGGFSAALIALMKRSVAASKRKSDA